MKSSCRGSIRQNKQEFPSEFVGVVDRSRFDTQVLFRIETENEGVCFPLTCGSRPEPRDPLVELGPDSSLPDCAEGL